MPDPFRLSNRTGWRTRKPPDIANAETIFAKVRISLPAARSVRSPMIAGWMLVPRKAADEPATDWL
jgi:hypothetical protein